MKLKKVFLAICLMLSGSQLVISQNDSTVSNPPFVLYSVFVNVVPDQFKFPLVGFINTALGTHKGLEVGFINTTVKDFTGIQTGFVNTTLWNFTGIQLGFINTSIKDANGVQTGFINTAAKNANGIQLGFINTVAKNTNGLQVGFINTAAKRINGSQIGFINFADTVSNGVAVGFLSIIKNGGYKAFEVSATELYPYNVSFKIGLPQFYTYFQGSYNEKYVRPLAWGFGFGSMISLGNNFYFNPECGMLQSSIYNQSQTTSLATNIRYNLSSKLQVAAGLSAVWLNYQFEPNMYKTPFFSILNTQLDAHNSLIVGARVALSVQL